MNDHQKLAVRALEALRGDDLRRAQATFRDCTQEQMNGPWGHSGKTRREILAGYEAHDAAVTAAIAWVRAQG